MTSTPKFPNHNHEVGHDRPHASRADRPTSFSLAEMPLPAGREEDWRFTPLRRLSGLLDPVKITRTHLPQVTGPQEVQVRVVDRHDAALGKVGAPGDRAAVVAWNTFEQATIIDLPAGVELTAPVIVANTELSAAETAQHLVIRAAEGAKGLVMLTHTGPAQLNQSVEISVADGADLTVATTQEWDDQAIHLSDHRCQVGRDAKLKHIVVTLGGDLVRLCPAAEFTGPGGHVEMLGVYFTDSGQHQEHRPFVDHSQPHCYSRVTYKGALQGQGAHAVWVGDCLIGKNADGTDTYELNRNLVLTKGAKADSVPNLEIENGEIEGAGHASATGRFDDDQLFYLMSRGISADTARRLVVRGFFNELVAQIGIPEVEKHLMSAIEHELDKAEEATA